VDEPGLGDAAAKAHAEFFADVAESARSGLAGAGREQTLDRLAFEIGNLTAAWRYWVEAGDLEQLDKMTDALWAHHDARGWYQAAVALTDDLLRVLASVPSTADRAREAITLHMSLARGLLAIRGYTEDVEAAYGRALELCEELGEVPRLAPVLGSLASFTLYQAEFEKTAALGRQLLELAEQEDDVGLQIEGHLLVGSSMAFVGRIPEGLEHLERAIALFDPSRNPPTRFRLGPSPGVAAHTTSAHLLWVVGFPERARERSIRGEELARRLNHPFTLAYALFHVGLLDLWRRDFEPALERADALAELAAEHDFQIWTALALALRGAATSSLGGAEEGLDLIDRGVALYRGLKTPPVFWPNLLGVRAGALGLAGRPAEGVEVVDEAIELSGEDSPLYPDAAVLRGHLQLAAGDREGALDAFRQALRVGERYGARIAQLRAAVALCRNGSPSADVELRRVYEEFSEGLDLPDLVEARDTLQAVGDHATAMG
jgi:tetratricopeptide (TPR) repeat protein